MVSDVSVADLAGAEVPPVLAADGRPLLRRVQQLRLQVLHQVVEVKVAVAHLVPVELVEGHHVELVAVPAGLHDEAHGGEADHQPREQDEQRQGEEDVGGGVDGRADSGGAAGQRSAGRQSGRALENVQLLFTNQSRNLPLWFLVWLLSEGLLC